MKFIALSVRDDEIPAIKEWEKRHPGTTVDAVDWEINMDTIDRVKGYDGIVIQQRGVIDKGVYPKLKEMGFKQMTTRTAGYDNYDLKLARENGLTVTNVPAYSPRSVAELALTHTMRLIRKQPQFDERMSHQNFRWAGLEAMEIHSMTIGIIGAGRIGATSAQIFNALGAKVIAFDVKPNHELDSILTFKTKEEVLKESDVVCLHVDLNENTKNLIDAQALKMMKPTAYLVNECRGPVIDTDALIEALENKEIAGAALDTLTGEENFFNFDLEGKELPSEQLKKLRGMVNVILTPHVGFYTNIAVQNMVDTSLDDAYKIVEGKTSEHAVN